MTNLPNLNQPPDQPTGRDSFFDVDYVILGIDV